jgi:uncharacterized protein (UPF0248 family)
MENKVIIEQSPAVINKEDVPNYQFISYDVLDDVAARAQRKADLEKAMVLGNGAQVKISIVFLTTDGLKKVETTVWAATDEAIMLKGGVSIPVHCIKEIRFL